MTMMLLVNSGDMPTKKLKGGKRLLVCKRCDFPWMARKKTDPERCPSCNSRAWKRDRITETGRPAKKRRGR